MSRRDLTRSETFDITGAFTGPLLPDLLATKEGFTAFARRIVLPPDLQDCAPPGTGVRDTDPRMMYHGEMLPVETDDMRKALNAARGILRTNRFRSTGRSVNMVVDGPRGSGKSLLLALIGRAYQAVIEYDSPADPNRIPVAYINVPHNRDDDLHWSLPFAEFLGLEHTRSAETLNHRSIDMTEPVVRVMNRARTQLVLIDGIERIRENERRTAFGYIFGLQERTRLSFVFCGIGAHEIVRAAYRDYKSIAAAVVVERPDDAKKREALDNDIPVLWVRQVPYTPAEPGEWEGVLDAVERDLRLYKHERGTLVRLARYLHGRTGGFMPALNLLICQAAQAAIEDRSEAVTHELLETILTGRGDTAYNT